MGLVQGTSLDVDENDGNGSFQESDKVCNSRTASQKQESVIIDWESNVQRIQPNTRNQV